MLSIALQGPFKRRNVSLVKVKVDSRAQDFQHGPDRFLILQLS